VDDRDALRLSADAMARNVMQSFQKAMDWRIQTWLHSLCRILVQKEQEMKKGGASADEIKSLMHTEHAVLISTLRAVSGEISVTAASTSFQVLPQRVQKDPENSTESDQNQEPLPKRPRTDPGADDVQCESSSGSTSVMEEELDYQYAVIHRLIFHCLLHLQTPAGYSEISLDVPGTMEGTFLSSDHPVVDYRLRSVVVNLDTNILAAMVERSSRTIVRSSIEAALAQVQNDRAGQPEEQAQSSSTLVSETKVALVAAKEETPPTLVSPAAATTPPRRNASSPPAFITPRGLFNEEVDNKATRLPSASSVLLPIPDDLDDKAPRDPVPRRISPQPSSPELIAGAGELTGSAPPVTPGFRTPPRPAPGGKRLPLISPPVNEGQYHDVPENGPSLPLLVEAACRAMEDN
jgi:hypothetical protein